MRSGKLLSLLSLISSSACTARTSVKAGGWLKERVFSIASIKTPDEWIRAITGESLNVNYYLDYLEKKYTEVYGL